MKRVLLDQGVPRDAAALLRDLGWDAVHAGDLGLGAAEDSEILTRAQSEKRVCVTLDADSHALLALSGASGLSAVRVRLGKVGAAEMARILGAVWQQYEVEPDAGAMVTVTAGRARVRPLPIH
jgi:predicted nuclease of predicted toxin-antitoxin system